MPDTTELVEIIASDFYHDKLDLSERSVDVLGSPWSQMPEVKYVRRLYEGGTPGRKVRLFVTFLSAMDRARDSESLWNAGFNLFNSLPELFDPITISAISIDTLFNRLKDSNVSQRHQADVNAWWTIAHTLTSEYPSSVQKVIDDGIGDAEDLLRDLKSNDHIGRPRFPLLRGPKIGAMWVRILANPGKAKIDRIDLIPVAVDIHVCRVTENLGVTGRQRLVAEKDRGIIQSVWRDASATAKFGGPSGIGDTCAALDPALWYFGKFGCSHCEKVGQRVPISRACSHCQFPISTQRYLGSGISSNLTSVRESHSKASSIAPATQQNDHNQLLKQHHRLNRNSNLSHKQILQVEYWVELQQVLDATGGPYSKKRRKPQPQNWMSYSVGRSSIVIYIFIGRNKNGKSDNISVELTMNDHGKVIFKNLERQKEEIEKELGYELAWEERPNAKESRICIFLSAADAYDPSDWERQHQWFTKRLNEVHRVFFPRAEVL